jgi:hypothetical protein
MPNELHIVSLLCRPSQTLGDSAFTIHIAFAQNCAVLQQKILSP